MDINCFVVDKSFMEPFLPLLTEDIKAVLDRWDILLAGAEAEGRAVGAAVVSVDERVTGNASLLHIAVADEYRRKGIGTRLLNRVLRTVRQFAITSMNCVIIGEGKEDALEAFLTAWGMRPHSEAAGIAGSFTLEDVESAGVLKQHDSSSCLSLQEVRPRALNSCEEGLKGTNGFMDLDKELSYLYLKGDEVLATFLVQNKENALSIDWMALKPKCNPKILILLMEYSFQAAYKRYPMDTVISYSAFDSRAKKLISFVLGGGAKEEPVRIFSIEDGDFRIKNTN